MIEKLCKKYTSLSENDILILKDFARFLHLISEAQGCDVFIDCATRNPDAAIVVAECRPENSLYKNNVVGMYAMRENEPAALRTLETGIPSRGLKGLNQENIAIIQNVSAIRNFHEEVIGVFIMERDETEVFNREFLSEDGNGIHALPSKDAVITNYLDDGVIYFNNEGTVIYANPKAVRLFSDMGYRESLVGMRFHNVVLGNVRLGDVAEKNYLEINALTISSHVLNIKYHMIVENDIPIGIAMIINDITAIHKIEKQLISKTVDIKEVHHRVKNDLQTITSLLRLQARRLGEGVEKKILVENINRIASIALTHEILAKTDEENVDIKEIVTKLLVYISRASLPPNSKVVTKVEGDNAKLPSEVATSVFLVVNELVQNSFEHAFKYTDEGTVTISIRKSEYMTEITIKDDGRGFDISETTDNSLGLLIVKAIVEDKLEGDIHISSDKNGTVAIIKIYN